MTTADRGEQKVIELLEKYALSVYLVTPAGYEWQRRTIARLRRERERRNA